MKLKILLFSFISIMVFSCKSSTLNPVPDSNTDKQIWPLAVGNTWTYLTYTFRSSKPDSLSKPDTTVNSIIGKTTYKGEDWFEFARDGKSVGIYYINRQDGLWTNLLNKEIVGFDSATLAIKYPTSVNDVFYQGQAGLKTISINTQVSTPAGNFNCIRYIDLKEQTLEKNGYYISKGIGLVKEEFITYINTNSTPPDTIWIRMELKSYKLN